ncbi:hypothetical protein FISHEDRAFT_67036 [Fistulina hepatica ATCC 64428]|uniref:Rad51-like C-terminal domain-containing protein n=1 Tax=Fistulina hepatica ATCC 64428 TaxID=1128425 RepID=A0A0D7A390_9AGAR|nr:hypothetical protein FISHEDRAFT_67036 [Fistulina hepatica ATCC 64428]
MLSVFPPGSTNIPALDAHLFSESIHTHMSPESSLNWGDVIEIQGPAASGKSHLLYWLLITCISQRSSGGWDKSAVLIDTDGTFNAHRLFRLLRSHLKSASDDTVSNALRRLHVFSPQSSTQLIACLAHLSAYHETKLSGEEIGILAVDSISAFYWPDRFTVEQMRSVGDRAYANPLQSVLVMLRRFQSSHRPVIFLTNWGLHPLPNSPFFKQHLHPFPSPFAQASAEKLSLTHHITLSLTADKDRAQESELAEETEEEKPPSDRETCTRLVGLVRTPGRQRVSRFSLCIFSDHIVAG